MTEAEGKPSWAWYLVAGGLFLSCALGAPIVFVVIFIGWMGSGQQFQVPGATTIDVTKPGTYVVWYDHVTMFEGRSYAYGADLPNGLRIRVRDGLGEVPMSSGLGGSESSGALKRTSVGEFEALRPGGYSIDVTGPFEPRIFSVRRSLASRMLLGILGLVAAEILGWVGAPLLAVFVFLRRRNSGAPA